MSRDITQHDSTKARRRAPSALFALALGCALLGAALDTSESEAQGRRVPVVGRVAARGPVLRTEGGEPALAAAGGRPWLVEYAQWGEVVRRIGPHGSYTVMSTIEYNEHVTTWEARRAAGETRWGADHLITVDAAGFPGSLTCLGPEGTPITPPRAFLPDTRWLLVVDTSEVMVDCRELVVALSPLSDPTTPTSYEGSLILDADRNIVEHTQDPYNTFAVESAFFTPREGETRCQEQWGDVISVDPNGWAFEGCTPGRHNLVWAPMPGVIVETVSGNGFPRTATGATGGYELSIWQPQVVDAMFFNPFFLWGGDLLLVHWTDYMIDLPVFAEVRWQRFNPRAPGSRVYYMWQRYARPIIVGGGADTGVGLYYANFEVDTIMMRAVARMTNADFPACQPGSTAACPLIPLVDTEYAFSEFTQYEHHEPSEAERQQHWRVNQGLVSQISAADLRDTDVFIYRTSDGSLIGARWGFSPREVAGVIPEDTYGPVTIPPGCEDRACLDFTMMTRGPVSRGTMGGSIHTGGFDPHTDSRGAHRLEVDYLSPMAPYRYFLRTGDAVKVYLINRTTGYIGSVSAVVENFGGQMWINPNAGAGGMVQITMRPPNLRISARRVYDRDISSDTDRQTVVLGDEGSGLNTDEQIVITTEWYDEGDRPLPPGLPGYTGRIAQVVLGGELQPVGDSASSIVGTDIVDPGAVSGVGQFAIRPGLHTQIIHIPLAHVDRNHYYVHVDGAPPESTVDFMGRYGRRGPDFSTNQICYTAGGGGWTCINRTAGEGPLAQRPASFVPFLVQAFDRVATRRAYTAAIAAARASWTPGADPPLVDAVQPVYTWVRSPELSFSILDLEVDEVDLVTEYDERMRVGRTEAEVDYSLDDGVDPLDPMSGHDTDIMMGIGYGAVVALIDDDGNIDTREVEGFPSVEDLAFMTPQEQAAALDRTITDLEGDEFLTLQIWDRGDSGTALWEADGALMLVGDAHRTQLERRYTTARFEPGVPPPPEYLDSWDLYSFRLLVEADVEVRVTRVEATTPGEDPEQIGAALIERRRMPPGFYYAIAHAGDLIDRGIDPDVDPAFAIEIDAELPDADIPFHQRIRHRGRLSIRRPDTQVGQMAVGSGMGSVLLRDGSLRLSREDVTLPGVGPTLEFQRSYSNLGDDDVESIMGPGWSHNWQGMQLYALTEGSADGPTDSVPDWVEDLGGDLFRYDDLPDEVRNPAAPETEWTGVQVNGTEFRYAGSTWEVERGRYGTLERVGDELVFTSEDGTRYFYPIPTIGSATTIEMDPNGSELNQLELARLRDYGLAWRSGVRPQDLILGTAPIPGGAPTPTTELIGPGPTEPTRCRRIEDRNGNGIDIAYDAEGRVERLTDASDRQLVFAYEQVSAVPPEMELPPPPAPGEEPVETGARVHRLRSVSLEGVPSDVRLSIEFGYDARGYLISATRGARVENYGYEEEEGVDNAGFNLTTITQHPTAGTSWTTEYEYYAVGEVAASVLDESPGLRATEIIHFMRLPPEPGAGVPEVEYSYAIAGSEIVRTVENARGDVTRFYLNAAGNPVRIEEPLGRTTTMRWSGDEAGGEGNEMIERIETLGAGLGSRHTQFRTERDSHGRVIAREESGPCGTSSCTNTIRTTFDPRWAQPLSRTDRNGFEQSWELDDHGNVLEHHDAEGHVHSYTYNSRGLVETSRDPGASAVRRFTYDDYGNLDVVTSPEGRTVDYDFDARGRMVAQEDGLGRRTRLAYDEFDNVLSITRPTLAASTLPLPDELHSSSVESFTYDLLGHQLTHTDRSGLTVTKTYTPRGSVRTESRSGGGGTRSFTYDREGNLETETDWLGNVTRRYYDELNRNWRTVNRLGDDMYQEFDLAGRVQQVTDYAGRVTEYDYDMLDRMTREETAGARRITRTYYEEAAEDQNLHTETVERDPFPDATTTYDIDHLYRRVRRENPAGDEFVWEYEADGDLRQVTDEQGNHRTYEFDADHLLRFTRDGAGSVIAVTEHVYDDASNEIETIDPEGRHTTHTYDTWDRLISSTIEDVGPTGTTQAFTWSRAYDGNDRIVVERNAAGHVRTQQRDVLGRVTDEYDRTGAHTHFVHDANGRVLRVEGPRATRVVTYDAEDRETHVVEADGLPEERSMDILERDGEGHPTRVSDYLGRVTRLYYDGNYQLRRIEPPTGAPIVRTYSRNGLLVTEVDRRSATTTHEYDLLDRRTATIDPLANRVEQGYDAVGNVVSSTDARGVVTTQVLDALYRVRSVTRDGVLQESREYDLVGNPTSITNARGYTTEIEYNARNLASRVVEPRGAGDSSDPETLMRYDGAGNLVWRRDQASRIRTFEYDGEGRRTAEIFAGERRSVRYDASGNIIEEIEPESQSGGLRAGHTTVSEYDALDRLVRVAEGGLETRYAYDDEGNLTQIVDAQGRIVTITYDDLDRVLERTTASTSGAPALVTRYDSYDGEGAILAMTDARGQQFTYEVDALGRRIAAHAPAGSTGTITDVEWEFDANGNPTREEATRRSSSGVSTTEVTTAQWDDFDRLEFVVQRGTRIDFAHDAAGNRTLLGTTLATTRYEYDARNRVRTVQIDDESTTFEYEPDGQLRRILRPSGAETLIEYEPSTRVGRVLHRTAGGTTISESAYDYDLDGNRTRELTRTGTDTRTTFFEYDDLSRLDAFTVVDGDVAVGSPAIAAGARTSYEYVGYERSRETVETAGVLGARRDYVYDDYGRLRTLSEFDGSSTHTTTISYDANGNMLSRVDAAAPTESEYFDYDPWNQMTAAREGGAATTPVARYEYDASGLRIRELGTARGDVEAFYAGTELIEERNGANGALVAHYHQGPQGTVRFDGADGERSYYHADGSGSTVAMTGSTGAATQTNTIDPWGDVESQTGSTGNRDVFTGHRTDTETGLVYMGARYYDPELGQFTTADSYLGSSDNPASLQRYMYAYANPGRYWDPDGHLADELASGTSMSWGEYSAVDGGNSNAGYQPLVPESSIAVDPAAQRRGLTAEFTAQVVSGARDMVVGAIRGAMQAVRDKIDDLSQLDWRRAAVWLVAGIAIGVAAVVFAPAAICAIVAFAPMGIPIGAIALAGAAGYLAYRIGAEAYHDYQRAVDAGVENPLERAVLATLGRPFGLTDAYEALSGRDALTSRPLTVEERNDRLASGAFGIGMTVGGGIAARARPITGFCFAAGTLVAMASGSASAQVIEDVEVGDRVRVSAEAEAECSHEAREDQLRVSLVLSNEQFEWDTVYLDRLVSRADAEAAGYELGAVVWIDDPEFGVRGWATVSAVDTAEVEAGAGCVVSSTVSHQNADVLRLHLSDDTTVITTGSHRFWSATRADWVTARELREGESLRSASGNVSLIGATQEHELREVFNLEVEGAHQYHVGTAELLVHNGGCGATTITDAAGNRVTELGRNATYTVNHSSGLVSTVETGAGGRIERVTADLARSFMGKGTAPTTASRAGIDSAVDDAGHIIARRLGGTGGVGNIFPQLQGINRGIYREFEGEVADLVRRMSYRGRQVSVEIELIYGNKTALRPTGLNYHVYVDGVWQKMSSYFDNF